MEPIKRIQKFEQIKVLSDSRRLALLRMLMAAPATLSQLGVALQEHPARVRHHLKLLETAGLVELVSTHVVRGFVEKYYRARAHAYIMNEIILPASSQSKVVVALGSHDLALELLAQRLSAGNHPVDLLALPVGSLDGLVALYQGVAQMAGCHLLDAETGEYNLPYVRHLFPGKRMAVITLALRIQGLLLAAGNPLGILGLEDLARPGLMIINRNRGSGTRLWLDRRLNELGINTAQVSGYQTEAHTHTEVAEAILRGRANLGLGLQATARRFGLGFIPLFQERYDLVLPDEQLNSSPVQAILNDLHSANFRQAASELVGYDTFHSGDQVNL